MFKISYDKKITMVQGDTGVIRMRIHNYELSQGDEVRFAIVNKANPSILLCQHSDKKIVLEKQVTVFEKDGSARIVIQPYDTEYLQPGKYLYEIQVKTKDGRVDTVVPLTSFTLMDGSIQGEYGQTTPSKPEPTPSEIELRFKRIENEIIPELGTRITNVENEIDNMTNFVTTKQFGIVGDNSDESLKFKRMFEFASDNKISTIILEPKTYNIGESLIYNNSDCGLTLNGNGAIINLIDDGLTLLDITAKEVIINNLTIDGINTTQDKWDITDYYNELRVINGIKLNTNKVKLTNSTFKNFYGSAVICLGVEYFLSENVTIDNVGGHWYENNTYDSFGDGYYFRGCVNKTKIYIINGIVNLKRKYDNTYLSRAGLVLERSDAGEDLSTHVKLINVDILNADRGIHVENQQDRKIVLSINECNFLSNCSLFSYSSTNVNEYVINSSIINNGSAYGGSIGIKTCKKLVMKDCVIDAGNIGNSFLNNVNDCIIKNCIIKNVNGTIFSHSVGKIEGCKFTINSSAYLNYKSSQLECINCIFDTKDGLYIKESASSTNTIIKNCIFNNYYIQTSDFNKSYLYLNSEATILHYNINAYVYVDNILTVYPNKCNCLPYDNEIQQMIRSFSDTDQYYHVCPDSMLVNVGKRYIILFLGSNSNGNTFNNSNFEYFYYCECVKKNDGTFTVGELKTYGTVHSSWTLNLDDENKTVSKKGGYATKVHTLVIPSQYINCLPIKLEF